MPGGPAAGARARQRTFWPRILWGGLGLAVLSGFLWLRFGTGLRPPEESPIPKDWVLSTGRVQAGDSLYGVLKGLGISGREISGAAKALESRLGARFMRPGDTFEVAKTSEGELARLRYKTQDGRTAFVDREGAGVSYRARIEEPVWDIEVLVISGIVRTTLYEAMTELKLPPELVHRFADIFAWQVDFLTEPRVGDTFRLLWERHSQGGRLTREGRILAASYEGKEAGPNVAIFYQEKDGRGEFYSPNGQTLQKFFLRAPLNYRRVSSHFSRRRFHPILRRFRPHLGIDYAAPRGTPVVSVGEGTVEFAGWDRRGMGRFLRVRHNATYTTYYGHLSRFAKGIRRGGKVGQGQVIGYVGVTGLATGPHLDFRIRKNGQFVNFLKLSFPASAQLGEGDREGFEKIRDLCVEKLTSAGAPGREPRRVRL